MAPATTMFFADVKIPKISSEDLGLGLGLGYEELRRKNKELEREVREREESEEKMRRELERTRERLRTAEDAEEMLCSQLGDLEAEAVAQAMEFRRRIKELSAQLIEARRIIGSASAIEAR